ncbi:MAG: hypothetical protein U5S82_05885 [Gammaproteobacteria bacterium]|nr:hypothetical protein [Gammaproteobacteria bacterium]
MRTLCDADVAEPRRRSASPSSARTPRAYPGHAFLASGDGITGSPKVFEQMKRVIGALPAG